jgi:hypothetical protein
VTQILIRVIAVPQLDGGREHGAILDVGHQPSPLFPVAVHYDDFARTAARDERCDARRSTAPAPIIPTFICRSLSTRTKPCSSAGVH